MIFITELNYDTAKLNNKAVKLLWSKC